MIITDIYGVRENGGVVEKTTTTKTWCLTSTETIRLSAVACQRVFLRGTSAGLKCMYTLPRLWQILGIDMSGQGAPLAAGVTLSPSVGTLLQWRLPPVPTALARVVRREIPVPFRVQSLQQLVERGGGGVSWFNVSTLTLQTMTAAVEKFRSLTSTH